jgi:hypothetical protein
MHASDMLLMPSTLDLDLAVQDKNPAPEAAEEFNRLATAYAVRDAASALAWSLPCFAMMH